jgi:transcriptional regulator with XRE-family HTH domain
VTPDPADQRAALGRRLRTARKAQGRSQSEVAAALGTDQKVVSRAENGQTTVDTQLRIAGELGLDLVAS